MIIDGQLVAFQIQKKIGEAIDHLQMRKPGLAFIIVGKNPASESYVRMKKKRCVEVGIFSIDREFPENISEKELLKEIDRLNQDPAIDGILVQLPLPLHLSNRIILSAIDPEKDVDGFNPINMGKLLLGESNGFTPCTPLGIQVLLTHSQISLLGKHVVILGRSTIVGKPLAALLMQKAPHCNATVTVANSLTENLNALCKTADVLVAAMGQPEFVKATMVKQGATVIDVGINRMKDGRIVGDVDFESVAPLCSHITPVPKGVGPMTIAMLLSNTLLSYQRRMNRQKSS